MSNQVLFSIIVPAYNIENYIGQAIESCLAQEGVSSSEYEIIVINDGSKDKTARVVDRYSAYGNVVVVHQDNAGLSATRNRGMVMAKGEYIMFLDGDDWLASDALATLKAKVGNADVVVFPMVYYFDENEHLLKSYCLGEKVYRPEEFLRLTIGESKLNIIPAPKAMYFKSVICECGVKFVEGILHEDGPFFFDVMMNVRSIEYVDKGLYYYRQSRVGSITAKQTIRNFEGMRRGNDYLVERYGLKNPDLAFYLMMTNIFESSMRYANKVDYKEVTRYYRKWTTKRMLIRVLSHARFRMKYAIMMLMVIIDPEILHTILKHKNNAVA